MKLMAVVHLPLLPTASHALLPYQAPPKMMMITLPCLHAASAAVDHLSCTPRLQCLVNSKMLKKLTVLPAPSCMLLEPCAQAARAVSPMSPPLQYLIHAIATLNRPPIVSHDAAVLPSVSCGRCLPCGALAVQLQLSAVLPEQGPGRTLVCLRCVRPLLTLFCRNNPSLSASAFGPQILNKFATTVHTKKQHTLLPKARPPT